MAESEKWRMYERKAIFVKGFGALLSAEPETGVRNMTYRVDESSGAETVEILFEGGLTRKVDVTADSATAIIKDLMKVVEKYV